jgi:aldose 1-epimerase
MYRHQILPFGKFQKQLIANEKTGNAFMLVPAHGACIIDIQLDGQSVLDGCATPIELDLNNWGKSAILLPFPNRLDGGQYTWDGKTYEFPVNDPQTDNALHGFATDQPMEITEIKLDKDQAMVHCLYQYDGHLNFYPFPFNFSAIFRIAEPSAFEVSFKISNEGPHDMPVGMGWHPYFQLSGKLDDMELHFSGAELVGLDERMIPTGKLYEYDEFDQNRVIGATVLDNCFAIKDTKASPFQVSLKGEKGTLHFWQETGPGKFNYIQLFTPPNRKALAIEPMTCNVNAFNNGEGLARLKSGEEMEATFGFSLMR